jgi:hypothetical protein
MCKKTGIPLHAAADMERKGADPDGAAVLSHRCGPVFQSAENSMM